MGSSRTALSVLLLAATVACANDAERGVVASHVEAVAPVPPPTWVGEQELVLSDAGPYPVSESPVALSGDTLLLGAVRDDDDNPGEQDPGSAYVFERSGGTWTETQKIMDPEGAPGDYFGRAVALSGDSALIGASEDDGRRGSASIFVRSGGTWTRQQKLVATDRVVNENFGASVALSGGTALVGANDAVYVFTRSGATWSQSQRIERPGRSVCPALAISGSTAIAGFICDTTTESICRGSASIYERSGGVWAEQQRLLASDGGEEDRFGNAVAISGESVLVGASSRGAAYAFARSGTTWSEQRRFAASPYFGLGVGISGDVALVSSASAAYIWTRTGASWKFYSDQNLALVAPFSPHSGDFGTAVALDGATAVVVAQEPATARRITPYVFRFNASGALGGACGASWHCASGYCADGACCDAACDGACDACTIAAGATVGGTCAVLAPGAPGAPACAPLACNGISAECAGGGSSGAGGMSGVGGMSGAAGVGGMSGTAGLGGSAGAGDTAGSGGAASGGGSTAGESGAAGEAGADSGGAGNGGEAGSGTGGEPGGASGASGATGGASTGGSNATGGAGAGTSGTAGRGGGDPSDPGCGCALPRKSRSEGALWLAVGGFLIAIRRRSARRAAG